MSIEFYIPLAQVIPETSLSRQSLTLVGLLTTQNKQEKINKQKTKQTDNKQADPKNTKHFKKP